LREQRWEQSLHREDGDLGVVIKLEVDRGIDVLDPEGGAREGLGNEGNRELAQRGVHRYDRQTGAVDADPAFGDEELAPLLK